MEVVIIWEGWLSDVLWCYWVVDGIRGNMYRRVCREFYIGFGRWRRGWESSGKWEYFGKNIESGGGCW